MFFSLHKKQSTTFETISKKLLFYLHICTNKRQPTKLEPTVYLFFIYWRWSGKKLNASGTDTSVSRNSLVFSGEGLALGDTDAPVAASGGRIYPERECWRREVRHLRVQGPKKYVQVQCESCETSQTPLYQCKETKIPQRKTVGMKVHRSWCTQRVSAERR